MPGLPCSYGDVTRLDLPIPLFLSDQPFSEFRSLDYGWETNNSMTLLVRKLDISQGKLSRTRPGSCATDANKEVDDVSIGGCPLECPFDPNENFEEAIIPIEPEPSFDGIEISSNLYDSLDLLTSRSLVKKIYKEHEDVLEQLHLDDGVGKIPLKNPIYLAVNGAPISKDLVLIGIDGEKFLELRMMGPYKREATHLNVDMFLAYHQHLPNVKPAAVSRHVHAVYEKVHGEFKADGKVFIEFVWADPKMLFEPPPAQNARVKLAIRPIAGDANPFLTNLWSEILSLHRLLELQHSLDMSELNRTHQNTSMMDTDCAIAEEVKLLLNKQSTPNWDKGFDFSDSLESVLERVSNLDRSDVDFTDCVWTILRKATTTTEIMECFHLLFSSVEGKLYRPYLFPGNDNDLGKMFKSILANESRNFRARLTPSLAMEMIVDCGINKLFKDYSFILRMCRLAETHEINLFAPKQRLFNESLTNIKKLHCILEVLCLSKERLSLPMSQQEAQTRTLIQYFVKNPLDWLHTFHFDIPMNTISNVITGMHPVYWNLKLESSNILRGARTNVIFSRDFFVSHARKLYRTVDGTLPRGYYLYVHRVSHRKV